MLAKEPSESEGNNSNNNNYNYNNCKISESRHNHLFSLAEQIRRCTACPLWKSRTLAVPGEGPADAKIMLIGEAPGGEEDRVGLPFIGKAGKFLMEQLQQIGIDAKNVFMTNAVKCHPPASRRPKINQLEICRDLWLDQQVKFIQPKLIILLGSLAILSSLGEKKDLRKVHGSIIEKEGFSYFLTYHPSAAMRFPAARKRMEKDFRTLKRILKRTITQQIT